MRLDGKAAIVTGGTSGIGEASAILFASEGAKVVVVGRNEERGAKVGQSLLRILSSREGFFQIVFILCPRSAPCAAAWV